MTRGVLPLQDNAPAYKSQVAITAVNECGFEIPPHHPPYSPDMAPFYIHCFFHNSDLRKFPLSVSIPLHNGP